MTGAVSVAICHDEPSAAAAQIRAGDADDNGEPVEIAVPVGGGAMLWARFGRTNHDGRGDDRAAAMERTARALRACARRWDIPSLPPLVYPDRDATTRLRVRERIEAYLIALTNTQDMVNAVVTWRGQPVASAAPLTELQRERLPFTLKRVKAESARRDGSSHAHIAGDDCFAQSFWFDACLVTFFDSAYSIDFVRHRVRLVTRELANLLPLLDEPEHDPAQVAPIPD